MLLTKSSILNALLYWLLVKAWIRVWFDGQPRRGQSHAPGERQQPHEFAGVSLAILCSHWRPHGGGGGGVAWHQPHPWKHTLIVESCVHKSTACYWKQSACSWADIPTAGFTNHSKIAILCRFHCCSSGRLHALQWRKSTVEARDRTDVCSMSRIHYGHL